jgi:hypothetical protein
MTTDRLLDRDLLRRAFDLLATKLARSRVVGELHVFGGAAMVLAFDERVATRDVDALFRPDGPVLEAAWKVADELGLPRSLNIVARFFPDEPISDRSRQLVEDLLAEQPT